MDGFEKREECISNLIQQIGWIEDIDAHKFPGWGHTVSAMRQAIALLKAQEPVKPNAIMHGKMVMYYQCPSCIVTIDPSDNFCRRCGRAVKWE